MVSTLDSESNNPSSNLGRTFFYLFSLFYQSEKAAVPSPSFNFTGSSPDPYFDDEDKMCAKGQKEEDFCLIMFPKKKPIREIKINSEKCCIVLKNGTAEAQPEYMTHAT